ncbi:Protein of unknown function [Actinokineospora alba]|uniref:DUF3558 domain-containing protein n=1 Tax=Actinokineospora alba TaxID=504798 RepID=A0A1H0K823_9PSEU|nr:DUF3558 domain-containing protein [Actinokineospora alba]TDP68012.1 uncharacterized protein DUF3558 [Actinokineospora alba]SDH90689.1 Protein of unknown function [Actinokineospora alba]SDO51933.1 Protein of unknown function [Actinokineospora alba]
MSKWTKCFGVAVVSLLAIPLVGCSTQEPGTPRPSDGITSTPRTSESRTTPKPKPTTSKPSSPLANVDPCGLLSDSDQTSLGIPAGRKRDIGKSRGCDWNKSGDFGFSIGLNGDIGLKDANYQGGTPRPIDIGKHEATTLENMGGGDGACDIYIAITESSMVHITATSSGASDTPKACAKALAVAKTIDPKLP